MPPKNQQPFNPSELLDDINYVNQNNKTEIKRINDQFQLCIAEVNAEGTSSKSIIKEISSQLGQLSAQVNLAEQAIRSIRLNQKQQSIVANKSNGIVRNGESLRFGVNQLGGNKNLLPIETNENGIDYIWSGANPETHFSFSLDRRKKLGMQIRLVSLIKQEYPEQLKVFIDGTHIQHTLSMDDGLFVVSCFLPSSSKADRTDIKIVLPATHRPMDLGDSGDGRTLGIAINEIRFGKPEGRFGLLLKQLKLKS